MPGQATRPPQERTEPEDDSLRRLELISAVWAIVARPDLPPAAKLDEVLRVGCAMFGETIGIVSRVDGDDFRVLHVHAAGRDITPGDIYELGRTFCAITVAMTEPVAIDHMAESIWSGHPCYEAQQLESYIGVGFEVDGEPFGTLSFASPKPHEGRFREIDREFVGMLGAWVGSVLTEEARTRRAVGAAERRVRFVADTNHEFRAPAAGISGLVDVLATGVHGSLSPKQLELLGLIRHAAERLTALAEDVGDIFRIDAGSLRLDCEAVDPFSVAARVAGLLESTASSVGVAIVVPEPAPRFEVWADERRLEQIVVNLVSNAIKFTPRGGRVGVDIDASPGRVHVAVWDTGVGISPSRLPVVFDRYAQVQTGGAPGVGGTGLGLALARELAELQGGGIRAESTEGEGSRFTVSLPAAPDDPSR